jgi:hypothetical protein
MNSQKQRPSLLAKILGIYTVKIVANGVKKSVDLIVMENLMYDVSISRTYDLKGAVLFFSSLLPFSLFARLSSLVSVSFSSFQPLTLIPAGIASRIAKPKAGSESGEGTGWDGDWLTGAFFSRPSLPAFLPSSAL